MIVKMGFSGKRPGGKKIEGNARLGSSGVISFILDYALELFKQVYPNRIRFSQP
jgi:hypothetical protein